MNGGYRHLIGRHAADHHRIHRCSKAADGADRFNGSGIDSGQSQLFNKNDFIFDIKISYGGMVRVDHFHSQNREIEAGQSIQTIHVGRRHDVALSHVCTWQGGPA